MASTLVSARHALKTSRALYTASRRSLATPSSSSPNANASTSTQEPLTHYRITLRRSAISLGSSIKGTLAALGLHRRLQTVYQRHTPEAAGKILRVKELVAVENVPASAVRTKTEQRHERRSPRGYTVVGSAVGKGAGVQGSERIGQA